MASWGVSAGFDGPGTGVSPGTVSLALPFRLLPPPRDLGGPQPRFACFAPASSSSASSSSSTSRGVSSTWLRNTPMILFRLPVRLRQPRTTNHPPQQRTQRQQNGCGSDIVRDEAEHVAVFNLADASGRTCRRRTWLSGSILLQVFSLRLEARQLNVTLPSSSGRM